MITSAERLRQERERLGLSQAALAALAGVTRNSQIKYESGERKPDIAYLVAVARAGVDILYVSTGERAVSTYGLPADEEALLENYRASDDRSKAHILEASRLAALAAYGHYE